MISYLVFKTVKAQLIDNQGLGVEDEIKKYLQSTIVKHNYELQTNYNFILTDSKKHWTRKLYQPIIQHVNKFFAKVLLFSSKPH